jgi:transposase
MVGGNPGALLLNVFGLAVSPDKLLRVVHALPVQLSPCPKAIGVDEFALKRGIDYGCVIVDLETGQSVDLLPRRDTETVSQWLERQPHIEVVARDRSKEFAFAVTQALPQAKQVLDRWHVLKNLRETLERELTQFQQTLKQTLGINGKVPRSRNDKTKQEASVFKRRELFARIRDLHNKGTAISQISRSVGVSRATVHQAIRADALPEARQNRQRTTSIDVYHSYLARRFSEGCTVAKQLWLELQQQGYTGSYAPVRRWVYMHKHYANQAVEPKAIQTTPKQLAYLLLRDETSFDDSEKIAIQRILESLDVLRNSETVNRGGLSGCR